MQTNAPLPLRQYFVLLSWQSCLLIASFLYLPRSSSWLFGPVKKQPQRSSADRPEHPFLTPLTVDPLSTMLWGVGGTFIIMIWWGQHMKTWWTASAGNEKRAADDQAVLQRRERVGQTGRRLGEACLTTLFAAIVLSLVLITLGAPLNAYLPHTFLLSLHLCLLLVWPVIHALGLPSIFDEGVYDRYRMTRLLAELHAATPLERSLIYPIVGASCGAWMGAWPVPLDWDRPWQSYPLTLVAGSILGFVVGGFTSFARSAAETSWAGRMMTQTSVDKTGRGVKIA